MLAESHQQTMEKRNVKASTLRRMKRNMSCMMRTQQVIAQLQSLNSNPKAALALEQASEEAENYLQQRIETMHRNDKIKRILFDKMANDGRFSYADFLQNHESIILLSENIHAVNEAIFGEVENNDKENEAVPCSLQDENAVEGQTDNDVEDKESDLNKASSHKGSLMKNIERRRRFIAEHNLTASMTKQTSQKDAIHLAHDQKQNDGEKQQLEGSRIRQGRDEQNISALLGDKKINHRLKRKDDFRRTLMQKWNVCDGQEQ